MYLFPVKESTEHCRPHYGAGGRKRISAGLIESAQKWDRLFIGRASQTKGVAMRGRLKHALQQVDLTIGFWAVHVGFGGRKHDGGRSVRRELRSRGLAGSAGGVSKYPGQSGSKLPGAEPSQPAGSGSEYAE